MAATGKPNVRAGLMVISSEMSPTSEAYIDVDIPGDDLSWSTGAYPAERIAAIGNTQ